MRVRVPGPNPNLWAYVAYRAVGRVADSIMANRVTATARNPVRGLARGGRGG